MENRRNSSFSRRTCLFTICLAFCCGAAAAQANRCEEERAKEEFLSGIGQWAQSNWEAAEEHLRKAADLCPVPVRPFSVEVGLFYTYQYMPFYYLGESYFQMDDFPNALRNLYLSSWRREGRDKKEKPKELASHVDSCRRWFDRAGIGERNSYFSDGHKLRNDKDWGGSAERMWDALQVEKETGETINASGRWPDPYLPRFWLAKALAELGCYQDACRQLKRSLVNQLSTKAVEDERKKMEDLQRECKSRGDELPTSEPCRRWRCWLQMGGLQPP